MKNLLFITALVLLSACSSKDEQFCKCLKAGEELNKFSSTLLESEITEEKAQKMKALKSAQTKECVDYQTMKGDEMLEKKAACK